MSYEEFYELLPLDGWSVDERGRIRRYVDGEDRSQCPITAAAGIPGYIALAEAADKLGLEWGYMDQIVWAADQPGRPESEGIRRQLLARLGLQE